MALVLGWRSETDFTLCPTMFLQPQWRVGVTPPGAHPPKAIPHMLAFHTVVKGIKSPGAYPPKVVIFPFQRQSQPRQTRW